MTAKVMNFPNPPSRNIGQEVTVQLADVETYPSDIAMNVVLKEINRINAHLDQAIRYAVTSRNRALRFRETAKEHIQNNKARVRTRT